MNLTFCLIGFGSVAVASNYNSFSSFCSIKDSSTIGSFIKNITSSLSLHPTNLSSRIIETFKNAAVSGTLNKNVFAPRITQEFLWSSLGSSDDIIKLSIQNGRLHQLQAFLQKIKLLPDFFSNILNYYIDKKDYICAENMYLIVEKLFDHSEAEASKIFSKVVGFKDLEIMFHLIRNGLDPNPNYHIYHPVNLDSVEEVVNSGCLTFKNGLSITNSEFDDLCRKAIILPSFLDPFCKSILEAFRDENKLTLPFYNFLFNGLTHVFEEFDPEAPQSWDFLINLAFVQFLNSPGTGNQIECKTIIENVVITSYQLLAKSSLNFNYDRFCFQRNPMADDFSVSAYLEEIVLEALIDRFKLLFSYENEVDAQVHFKMLLWEVINTKDIPIRSKNFNYHCALLTNTPFKYFRILRWNFDHHNSYINQVEPFLEFIASRIYAEVENISHKDAQDILFNAFASVSKAAVKYSDTIDMLQNRNYLSPDNLYFDPFLWNPNDFNSFLKKVFDNSYIISSLSPIEKSLLELLQNHPTHSFRYFLLQNFYACDKSCSTFTFIRSLLFSAFNEYYEMSNGCIESDLKTISDSILPMFDLQGLSSDEFLSIIDSNHLTSIIRILQVPYYSANEALKLASYKGRVKIVKWILQQRRDISIDYLNGSFPSLYIGIIKIFLESRGSDITEESMDNALDFATRFGYVEIVKLFLELRGSDTTEEFMGHLPTISAKGVNNSLTEASRLGHFEIVKLILKLRGPDITKKGVDNAVAEASRLGHVKIVELLLERI